MFWFNIICSLIMCLLILASLIGRFRSFSIPLSNRQLNILLVVFLIIGAAVRIWKFGLIPAGFNQDEAMGAVDALALADYGTDRFGMWMPAHFTAWGFGQMSVLLSYLSVPFIKIFGLNSYTARIVVLLASLAALWVIYLFAKLLAGKKAALTILALFAINPWQIMQSRWALDCNLFPHFLLFSVYFLCLGIKRNKLYIYISMVFFGLCMYSYGIAWYTVPLFLVAAGIYLLLKKQLRLKDLFVSAIVYLFVAWPIFGVIAINFFKLPSLVTPVFTLPYFPDTKRTADILFFSPDFFSQLISNLKSVINIVLLQKPDLPWNTIPEFGTVYLFALPLILVGLLTVIKERKFEFTGILLIWLSVSLASGLIVNNVNVNRINLIFYPIIILCGIGLYTIIRRINLAGIIAAVIFVSAFSAFGASYFGSHSKLVGDAFYDGFGESLEYVRELDYERVYVTNWTQSENSWWVSEPLTLFHHSVDALYYQGKADAFSKLGRKWLPYADRYKYVHMKELQKDSSENAVYIGNINEQSLFSSDAYELVFFGNYFVALPLFIDESEDASSTQPEDRASTSLKEAKASGYNSSIILYVLVYVILLVLLYSAIKRGRLRLKVSHESAAIVLILFSALILRLFTAQLIEGWPNDIAANKYWANSAANGNIYDFYKRGWCDYPPLFVYVLAFIGKLVTIPWLQPSFTLLIKLPSIFADIITAYIIFRISRKQLNLELSLLAALTYAFNPAVYIDSTVWGQVDSFFTMIVVAGLSMLVKRKVAYATVFLTAAVLMKPQGVFFLPVLLFEVLKTRKIKQFFSVFIAGAVTAFAIVFPFALKMGPLWIFKLYLGTAGEYPAAAMNALNIFSLVGANFADGAAVPFLFSYNVWGLIFTAAIVIFSGLIYFKGKHIATPLLTAVLLNSGAFIFSTKMHERYMYPVIALLLLTLVFLREKRLLYVFAGFSTVIFLNIHILFYRVLLYDVQGAHLVGPAIFPLVFIISFANVAIFVYFAKTAYDIIIRGNAEYLDFTAVKKSI